MPEIRYRIPLLSAQAILAYATINERFPDRYTVALNKRETESTVQNTALHSANRGG